MENLKGLGKKYLNLLKERSSKSKVYQSHQMTGLAIASLLEDPSHKSLYMKLAKTRDNDELLILAKNISEMKKVRNKGAYFMKMLKS